MAVHFEEDPIHEEAASLLACLNYFHRFYLNCFQVHISPTGCTLKKKNFRFSSIPPVFTCSKCDWILNRLHSSLHNEVSYNCLYLTYTCGCLIPQGQSRQTSFVDWCHGDLEYGGSINVVLVRNSELTELTQISFFKPEPQSFTSEGKSAQSSGLDSEFAVVVVHLQFASSVWCPYKIKCIE